MKTRSEITFTLVVSRDDLMVSLSSDRIIHEGPRNAYGKLSYLEENSIRNHPFETEIVSHFNLTETEVGSYLVAKDDDVSEFSRNEYETAALELRDRIYTVLGRTLIEAFTFNDK